jgi:pimeloyl-ACP methyl ester carboxylesterase
MNELEIKDVNVDIRGLSYKCLTAGSGPLVLCLHGFPDNAHGWEPTLRVLAAAGLHAVAPFMRGYGPTGVPPAAGGSLPEWVADVTALHDHFGGTEDAALVGHDWGAQAAYCAAALGPDRWRRLVVASIPPATIMVSRLGRYEQLKLFWYQFLFLQPSADAIVAANDLNFIERLWADWSPGFDATAVLPGVKDSLRDPQRMATALQTYRALYDPTLVPAGLEAEAGALFTPHTQPTLYLHGADEGCIRPDAAEETAAALPPGSRVEVLADAGHFLQYERPADVAALIAEFVTAR